MNDFDDYGGTLADQDFWEKEYYAAKDSTHNDEYLKPCPFCGGKADYIYLDKGSKYRSNVVYKSNKCTVRCLKCEIELPKTYKGTEKAKSVWNKRVR